MTTTVPVPCTAPGCDGVVRVPKSQYDDYDELVLTCPHGHQFDHQRKTSQRLGIEQLMEAGDLVTAEGPLMVPIPMPTDQSPVLLISPQGRCGNAGAWCAEGSRMALPGWRRKLCDSCYRDWRSVVTGERN